MNEELWPEGQIIKSLLIHYIDVGNIPPDSVNEFLEKSKCVWWKSVVKQLSNQGIAVVKIPVRVDSATRLETCPLDASSQVMGSVCANQESDDEFLNAFTEEQEIASWTNELGNIPGVEVKIVGENL